MEATPENIISAAKRVREKANDLRYLEIAGVWADPVADTENWGDTGPAAYRELRESPGSKPAIDDAQSASSRPLGTEFDYVVDLFKTYAIDNDPQYMATMNIFDGFDTALKGRQESVVTDIAVSAKVADWSGNFARTFRSDVISPLEDVGPNQVHFANSLRATVEGYFEMVKRARQAAFDIARTTGDALAARIGESQAAGNTPIDDANSIVWTIVGASLSTASFVGSTAKGVQLALSHASTAKSVTDNISSIADVYNRESSIQGATSHEIISSMHDAINNLNTDIDTEEQDLARMLGEHIAEIDEWLNSDKRKHLVSVRPAMVDQITDHRDYGSKEDIPYYDEFKHKS